jgi:hypothetical protein
MASDARVQARRARFYIMTAVIVIFALFIVASTL